MNPQDIYFATRWFIFSQHSQRSARLYFSDTDPSYRDSASLFIDSSIRINMVDRTASSLDLDPSHTSCIGGRTVLTCRSCAGNAPRNSVCTSCNGRGFNMFVCIHCNPAAAMSRTPAATLAASTPAFLSRSSSTLVPTYNNQLAPNSVQRFGDRDGGSGGGRVETNSRTPRGS
ncbi:hypothetical protein BJY00DRAFT_6986 [Aspergillus carlsbadensis]|nr:hypothetical protein BJY00DRAFT_6986 [Aspergillus carlsbadensis]